MVYSVVKAASHLFAFDPVAFGLLNEYALWPLLLALPFEIIYLLFSSLSAFTHACTVIAVVKTPTFSLIPGEPVTPRYELLPPSKSIDLLFFSSEPTTTGVSLIAFTVIVIVAVLLSSVPSLAL